MSRNRPTNDGTPPPSKGLSLPLVRQQGREAGLAGMTRGWHCPYLEEAPRKEWQAGWDEVPIELWESAYNVRYRNEPSI